VLTAPPALSYLITLDRGGAEDRRRRGRGPYASGSAPAYQLAVSNAMDS
jgi:hypothetical protein